MDIDAERKAFRDIIKREPTDEELVMYLNHPGDAVKTVQFRAKYGDPNRLPLPVWFEGCAVGEEINFVDTAGKPHQFLLVSMTSPNDAGESMVRYVLDSEIFSQLVKVAPPKNGGASSVVLADPADKYQVGAPSNGDLWVMYVHPGDIVEEGEELFNVSIMKQEKPFWLLWPASSSVCSRPPTTRKPGRWKPSAKASSSWSSGRFRASAPTRRAVVRCP